MSGCWWFGSCPPGLFGLFGHGPGSRSECGRPPIASRVVFEGRGHRLGPEGALGATQDTRGHRPVAPICLEHVAQFLGTLNLAYVHTVEGSTGAARDFYQGPQPFDYAALKAAYVGAGGTGAWMLNNAYTLELAHQALSSGADLIAFGRPFIANPDLGLRLRQNGPFNEPDRSTFYGGLEKGYTDYPFLNASST